MIHTAEGALFQQAIVSACKEYNLSMMAAREREVWQSAAIAWHMKDAGLRQQVDEMRKTVGAPWGTDQKTAMAFAVLALR